MNKKVGDTHLVETAVLVITALVAVFTLVWATVTKLFMYDYRTLFDMVCTNVEQRQTYAVRVMVGLE
jgi:uncharacterized membrane protein